MIDKNKIELMVAMEFPLEPNVYADSVYDLLVQPPWYQPIKRAKFRKQLRKRVHLILAEYAREVIQGIDTK